MVELDGLCVVGVEDGHGFDWAAQGRGGGSASDALPGLARPLTQNSPRPAHISHILYIEESRKMLRKSLLKISSKKIQFLASRFP